MKITFNSFNALAFGRFVQDLTERYPNAAMAHVKIAAFWDSDYYSMAVIHDVNAGKFVPVISENVGPFYVATQFQVDDLNQCVLITAFLAGHLAGHDGLPDALPEWLA